MFCFSFGEQRTKALAAQYDDDTRTSSHSHVMPKNWVEMFRRLHTVIRSSAITVTVTNK